MRNESDPNTLRSVRDALISIVEAIPPHACAGAAVWALGKLGDPQLKPIFTRFLAHSLRRLQSDGGDLWQGIIALGDCGEQSLQVSGGIYDFDRNVKLAAAYLQRQGAL